ncbi:MAG TPA: serine hydrolase domain-containing protein [Blastocatellia bacterium]|nr:serine hydrolase domain-containing protein [Blastocatellia bacterium]
MAKITESIAEFLRAEIGRGAFPGAQYLVGQDAEIVAEDALGWAVIEPEKIAANLNTIYDLASLTKPLVTALLTVIFAQRGALDLKAPLADYLQEFNEDGGNSGRPTLLHLLTHTSGLPPWRPLYLEATNRDDVVKVIARMARELPSGAAFPVAYSDLNYILLGFLLERVAGERLDRLAQREIFMPLGLQRTMFRPPPQLRRETAATERGQIHERGNAGEDAAAQYPWREQMIWGEVHDGNAHFLGGVAGHAGLFSTAREVFRMANQFLPGSLLLSPDSLPLCTQNFTPGLGDARSVGWMLAETLDCSAGPLLPPTAFGHTGFTGTSLWIDPEKRRVFILLTNRVHPQVGAIDLKPIRQRFHALAVEWLDRVK